MKLPTWFLSAVTAGLMVSAGWIIGTLIDVKEWLARIETEIHRVK